MLPCDIDFPSLPKEESPPNNTQLSPDIARHRELNNCSLPFLIEDNQLHLNAYTTQLVLYSI